MEPYEKNCPFVVREKPHRGRERVAMNHRERYKRLLILLVSFGIMAVQTGIFTYTWYHTYNDVGSNFFERGNYVLIAQYALMLYLFYRVFGGFKVGHLRVLEMLFSQTLAVLCVNLITYLELGLIGRWAFLSHIVPILKMTLMDFAVVVIWVLFSRWLYVKVFPPRRLLVVYGEYSPDNLIRKLMSREDKYLIEEKVSIDCDIRQIKKKILSYKAVLLTDIPAHLRNELLKFCFENNVRCYCVPKISDVLIMNAEDIHLFDTSLLLFRNIGLTAEQQFVKRTFDLLCSLLLFVLTLPLMLLIALAVKICDGGPVFFKQERLTKGGKTFLLYKFRSMRVASEEEPYCLTRKKDERVTPVGRVIRNLHLDELPQILNVLKGDMSLVGPRPECPQLTEEYTKNVAEFPFRLKVKAGLTGYAQVYGKYNTTPYDKLKLDLSYITGYSFLLDVKLLVLTFKILFQKENTEGIDETQVNAAVKEPLLPKKKKGRPRRRRR